MKSTIKTYFKLFIFLFGISLLLVNCEREEVIENLQEENIPKLTVTIVDFSNVESNEKVFSKIERIMKSTNKDTSNSRDTIVNNEYGFIIDTDYVKYVENGNYNSYNFEIIRDNPEDDKLENLFLTLNADYEYDAFIIKYDFTTEELNNLTQEELEYRITQYTTIDFNSSFLNKESSSRDALECENQFVLTCSEATILTPYGYEQVCGWAEEIVCTGGGGPGPGPNQDGAGTSDVTTGGNQGSGSSGGTSGTGTTQSNPYSAPTTTPPPTNAQRLASLLGEELTEEQIAWANDDLNRTEYLQLLDYFGSCNVVSSERNSIECVDLRGFGALALEAHMEEDEVDYILEIIIKKKLNDDYPCHANVISEAYGVSSPLTQIVLDVFEANDGTNLVFDYSTAITGNASTLPIATYNPTTHTCNVRVNFRESYLTTATDLSIAATTIHESLHAILVYMWEEGHFYLPSGTVDPNFSDLVEAYTLTMSTENTSGLAWTQHQYMISMISDITTSLTAYGESQGYNLSPPFYESLSWGGLTNFYEPKQLPNGDMNPEYFTLVNTIAAEQNNTNTFYDGNGNQILPQGQTPNISAPCN